ncbi:saccharopine dehydrogenase family protein [Saccharopolyspora pogona]|uniref:saccharopine dehydrogenase n=1 Tax=Saccharopolyspora pogona TaxID=333966 RepID=UPI001686A1F7|nr:saccharopine dehydrogenase [Saccharopolyspora pogona]
MSDELEFHAGGPVLVVGGYGTIGGEVARLAAPHWPLLLTGRTPERGAALAEELGAEVRRWDLADPRPFAAKARAVISTVNDPADRVLRAAVEASIPYVDITRWTSRLARASTPSTSWTALGLDYEVVVDGERREVMPLSDVRSVDVAGSRTKVASIDTPEQFTLPLTLGIDTAVTRIGFSTNASTSTLLAVKKLGFFRWGRGNRWRSLRRSLLYSPGKGGTAQIRIDVAGRNGKRTATIIDPAGQAHLTAVGGLLGLRRVLGEDGGAAPVGVTFPELTPHPEDVVAALAEHDVTVDLS